MCAPSMNTVCYADQKLQAWLMLVDSCTDGHTQTVLPQPFYQRGIKIDVLWLVYFIPHLEPVNNGVFVFELGTLFIPGHLFPS